MENPPPSNSTQGTSASWLERATRYLSIFQLLFLILSGSLGYIAITRVQQSLDDQKFLQSITGYISDLKPVIEITCQNVRTPSGGLSSHVSIFNAGKNVVRLTSLSRQLVGTSDNALVLPALELLPTSENGMEMDIAPGKSVWSHEGYAPKGFARDANDVDIVVNATAETATAVMTIAKTILAKRIPDADLDAYGKATVRCRNGPSAQQAMTTPFAMPPSPVAPMPPLRNH